MKEVGRFSNEVRLKLESFSHIAWSGDKSLIF